MKNIVQHLCRTIALSLLATLGCLLWNAKVQAQTPALDFPSLAGGSNLYQSSYSLGWSFSTNSDVTVSALGYYDSLKDGLVQDHEVGIYDASTCSLLTSTIVRPSDPLTGFFRYRDLESPVVLPSGKTYYIAGLTGATSGDPYAISVGSITVDPSITYIGFSIFGNTQFTTTLQCPNGVQMPGFNGDYGPSFLIGTRSLVTPKTQLQDPPLVTVVDQSVTLTFVAFDGVGTVKQRALNARALASLAQRAGAKKPKLSFEYAAEISRTADSSGAAVKKDARRVTSKRNQITVSKLKPGSYSAKYRVKIFSGKGSSKKLVGQTKFSPSATFVVS